MRCITTGRNIEVTLGLRDAIRDKVGKLDRYFSPNAEVIVTLNVQKNRQNIGMTIPVKGNIIQAEGSSSDMYVSIDLAEEIVERQIKKYRTKLTDKKQTAQSFFELFISEEPTVADEEIKTVKTKKFAVKPVDPEKACLQMELLGRSFYIFLDSDINQISVAYKRKSNTYGLIKPEL